VNDSFASSMRDARKRSTPLHASTSAPSAHVTSSQVHARIDVVTDKQALNWSLFYVAAIVAAEVMGTFIGPNWSLAGHLGILASVILVSARVTSDRSTALLLAFMISPILRIVSLTFPLNAISHDWWLLIACVPILCLTISALYYLPVTAPGIGLRAPALRDFPLTLVAGLIGIGLGYGQFQLLQSSADSQQLVMGNATLVLAGLILSAGILEEILFRGILQSTAIAAFGPIAGTLLPSLIFGALFIGHQVWLNVVLMVGVAVCFGLVARSTRSVAGPILGRCAAIVMFLLILPT
jgi:uncharacterized protein